MWEAINPQCVGSRVTFGLRDFCLLKTVLTTQPVNVSKWRRYLHSPYKKEGWRWIVRRGNQESEATGLLTGQLEGFQLLSGLNFPDRVGMQQAEGTSRGWKMMEDGPLKFAFKFHWLFCCFWCYNSKYAAEIERTVKQLIRLIQTHTAWPVRTFLNFFFYVSSFDCSKACYLCSPVTGR